MKLGNYFKLSEDECHFQKIKQNKPPLGIEPHNIWVEQRIIDLLEAMNRYIYDNRQIPIEWVDEYNKLILEVEH